MCGPVPLVLLIRHHRVLGGLDDRHDVGDDVAAPYNTDLGPEPESITDYELGVECGCILDAGPTEHHRLEPDTGFEESVFAGGPLDSEHLGLGDLVPENHLECERVLGVSVCGGGVGMDVVVGADDTVHLVLVGAAPVDEHLREKFVGNGGMARVLGNDEAAISEEVELPGGREDRMYELVCHKVDVSEFLGTR